MKEENKEIICSNLKCKYHTDKGTCKRKRITLYLNGVHTLNQGYQDYLKCSSFELDEEYKRMKEKVEMLLNE